MRASSRKEPTLREQLERNRREIATWPKWMRETPPDFRSEDERRRDRGLAPQETP